MLTAVLDLHFLTAPARQDRAATLAGPDNAVSRITNAAEAWPICSTMAAMVETPDWAALDPDFAAGKRAIGAGDWKEAVKDRGVQQSREPLSLTGHSVHVVATGLRVVDFHSSGRQASCWITAGAAPAPKPCAGAVLG